MSAVVRALQRDRSIEYARGKVRIVRRAGLEKLACGCYRTVSERLGKLLGSAGGGVLATVIA